MAEMEADADISRWVFEFLLHQNLNYSLLNSLAKSLPLPINHYPLTKTILLRQIRHHLSAASPPTATILRLLEQLQQLDYLNGFPDESNEFKAAYFDVLGTNFVGCLREKRGKVAKRGVYDEVKMVWKWRVSRGALFREVGLVAKEFLDWKDGVVGIMKGDVRGFENVRVYVEKEMQKFSPTFLEFVAGNQPLISLINGDRSIDKGDLLQVSRGDEPVIDADTGVVALYKKINGLPTPELKEGRLRDSPCSPDYVVSCKHDSEVKAKRRRQAKRWSKEEEDVLRNAVVKYGKGKWKFILYAYQHIFLERTETIYAIRGTEAIVDKLERKYLMGTNFEECFEVA